MILRQENLKRLHANTEMKIFWEEYEPVFDGMFGALGIPFVKEKELDSLKLFKDAIQLIPADKKEIIGLLLYKWLVSHKPKALRDGIMSELQAVGAKHMSEEWKLLAEIWLELQVQLMAQMSVPVLTSPVDEDNLPKKVFADYAVFLADFRQQVLLLK